MRAMVSIFLKKLAFHPAYLKLFNIIPIKITDLIDSIHKREKDR